MLKEQVEEVMVDLCPPPAVALAVSSNTVDLVSCPEEFGTMEESKKCYEL